MKRIIIGLLGVVLASTSVFAQDFSQVTITTIPVTDNIYMLQGS
jgi:hypothetical protein